MDEDYYFNIDDEITSDKVFVLVIYDISSNKCRTKFANLLLGYGFRIQKSAFEAVITKSKLVKLQSEIPRYIDETVDSVRLYKINGKGNVVTWGTTEDYNDEDIIII